MLIMDQRGRVVRIDMDEARWRAFTGSYHHKPMCPRKAACPVCTIRRVMKGKIYACPHRDKPVSHHGKCAKCASYSNYHRIGTHEKIIERHRERYANDAAYRERKLATNSRTVLDPKKVKARLDRYKLDTERKERHNESTRRSRARKRMLKLAILPLDKTSE